MTPTTPNATTSAFALGYAIRAAAKATGQSIQAYVLQACTERMTREGQPLTLDPPADNK